MLLLPDLTQDEMVAWATARGLPAYRGRQFYAAVFRRLATSFDELTDLPRDLRTEVAQEASLVPLVVQQRHRDEQAETEKALFRLADGALVEGAIPSASPHRSAAPWAAASAPRGCRAGRAT